MSLTLKGEYRGLVPSTIRDCKICMMDDSVQREYLNKIYDKRISVALAAKELGVTTGTWRNHLRFCVKNAVESALQPEIEGIAKKVVDYADELVDQLDRTKDVIKMISDDMEGKELDSKMLMSLAAFEKQLVHSIEVMAKLSGDLNNTAVMNISNVKVEFNDFKSKVMEILCPNCKEKLMDIYDKSAEEIKNVGVIKKERVEDA